MNSYLLLKTAVWFYSY